MYAGPKDDHGHTSPGFTEAVDTKYSVKATNLEETTPVSKHTRGTFFLVYVLSSQGTVNKSYTVGIPFGTRYTFSTPLPTFAILSEILDTLKWFRIALTLLVHCGTVYLAGVFFSLILKGEANLKIETERKTYLCCIVVTN